MRRRALGPRLLSATIASILFVGAAVAVERTRTPAAGEPDATPTEGLGTPDPGATTTPPRAPSPTGPDADAAVALLSDPAAAATADPEEVLAAGLVVGQGPWRWMTDPAWPVREERPVYVGDLGVEDGRRVVADLVIVHRLEAATDEVVLRFLPAVEALSANALEVAVEVDGRPVDAVADPDGLLRVPVGPGGAAGEALSLRIRFRYDLLTVAEVTVGSGPAAFGIHGRTASQAVLGHWAPLLTFETDPVVPWGDVGSFPVAIWSVQIRHDDVAVTGGLEHPCPGADAEAAGCTWARGVSLRDLAVVVQPVARELSAEVGNVDVRVTAGGDVLASAVDTSLREATIGLSALTDVFGPLAWRDVEVVAVPLGRGAAGMEFPGLVLVDDDSAAALGGGFGSYVLAHELGHQWFHALLGNGSFADPVIDESLAQYSAIVVYRELFGPDAAQLLIDQTMSARYLRFREGTRAEQPPAQPSGDFTSAESYGPLIYARGALAWVAAEQRLGPEGVQAFLRTLVAERGLEEVTTDDVIERAVAVDELFGQILSRYWESSDPVPIP